MQWFGSRSMLVVSLFAVLSWVGPVALAVSLADAQQNSRKTNATVTLISEHRTLVPGQQTWLGLRFQMQPGWHIYWRNPGGAGSPPAPRWQVPSSISVGEIRWPIPERIVAGPVTSYGYENDVLLMVPVTVATGTTGDQALAARVNYVICSKVCIQESFSTSLTLPVSSSAAPSDNVAMFEHARTRLPQQMPTGWRTSAALADDTVTLQIDTGTPANMATFFPFDPSLIDETAPQTVTEQATGLALVLRKSPYFTNPPATVDGVLVVAGQPGVTISAPVRQK